MRWRGLAIGALVVVVAVVAGFVVGRRTAPEAREVPGAGTRLQVAAWFQEWPPLAADAVELHVSPTGTGTDCTATVPCSLLVARDQVRVRPSPWTTDVAVLLAGGSYVLGGPLVLGPGDSGRDGHRVVYRAAPGERPVLTGGRPVTGWRASPDHAGALVADVAPGTSSRQLWVGGQRATRARGPLDPKGWVRTPTGFTTPDDRVARWQAPSDLEVVGRAEWRQYRCPVASVQDRSVTLAEPCNTASAAPSSFPFTQVSWIENAPELLDEPGEWYLDRAANRLMYLPRPGEDLSGAAATPAVLGVDESLLELHGTAAAPVHDVGIEGITFAETGWAAPSGPAGYVPGQAGFHRGPTAGPDPLDLERTPGAVRIDHAHHVRFSGNRFEHLGGVGLDAAAGTQDLAVVGNRLVDISSTAIQVGEVRQGAQNPPPADQVDRIQIADDLVDRAGAEHADGVGIFASYVANATIAHDELAHLPYSGISLGWGWGTDSYARGNVLVGNRLTDVVTELQDGGAIYTLSPQPGSVVERNVVDGQPHRSGALFLDEGTAFVTVADNVVRGTSRWLHMWAPSVHDNVVVDNCVDGGDLLDGGARNVVRDNHTDPATWPARCRQVLDEAGLEAPYVGLRTG